MSTSLSMIRTLGRTLATGLSLFFFFFFFLTSSGTSFLAFSSAFFACASANLPRTLVSAFLPDTSSDKPSILRFSFCLIIISSSFKSLAFCKPAFFPSRVCFIRGGEMSESEFLPFLGGEISESFPWFLARGGDISESDPCLFLCRDLLEFQRLFLLGGEEPEPCRLLGGESSESCLLGGEASESCLLLGGEASESCLLLGGDPSESCRLL